MEFSIVGNVVDVLNRSIHPSRVSVLNGTIQKIEPVNSAQGFLMPGFVDSHIHIESSMLVPSQFAQVAVRHGTVATVSDPHEIANVCGHAGVEMMLKDAAQTGLKICFGAPACVPATDFETSGAHLDSAAVAAMLADPRIGYLSEVMDFPGVLNGSPEILSKIEAAKALGKPIDGHAPGLRGSRAANYIDAGITTDHECFTLDEALDKISAGCKIAIREGSAARNFDALQSLIDDYPESCMLCSDDKHPDELLLGHINQLVSRAIANGRDLMNVLTVACVNPVRHYGLDVGLLQVGDPADFILVRDLESFLVEKTYIDGILVADNGKSLMPRVETETLNQFIATRISQSQLDVRAVTNRVRVIQAIDGQLITKGLECLIPIENGLAVSDLENDVLKIVVVNRYSESKPSVGFVTGFGLASGAFASSVAHDSHNIVAVGANDEDLVAAINAVVDEQGGLAVSANGETSVLPLPVAGLMSTDSCETVGEHYSVLDRQVKQLGCTLRAPFMTLSFMALLVIPSLKLSDQGLFDVDRFVIVPLFID